MLLPHHGDRTFRPQQRLERGEQQVLLNMAGVRYMDSTNVGDLVVAYTTAANRGIQLKLQARGPRPSRSRPAAWGPYSKRVEDAPRR